MAVKVSKFHTFQHIHCGGYTFILREREREREREEKEREEKERMLFTVYIKTNTKVPSIQYS